MRIRVLRVPYPSLPGICSRIVLKSRKKEDLEEVEYVAELYSRSLCIGRLVILDDEEMSRMIVKFQTNGRR